MLKQFFLTTYNRGAAYDVDAQAGFTYGVAVKGEAELSDEIKIAVNNCIVGLKEAGLWDSIYALYLMAGGTAGWHSINWKNLGVYDITWVGSPTHSATGVKGNGVNQYGDTNFNDSTEWVDNNGSLGYYSGENISENRFMIGARLSSGGNGSAIGLYNATTSNLFGQIKSGLVSTPYNLSTAAMIDVSRTNDTQLIKYRNGAVFSTLANAFAGGFNGNITVMGLTGVLPTSRECRYADITKGLSTAQILAKYNIIQAYETALSRNV